MKKVIGLIAIFILTAAGICAQVASGGSYALSQTVVASGGGTSSDAVNNNYKIESTSGQPAAGTFSSTGNYAVRGGFWAANQFAPTAAGVSLSGSVVSASGIGIRNVTVILTGGRLLAPRTTRTTTFGSFTFDDVEVGQLYTITVQSKKYGFQQDSRIISVMDTVSDILFQANWEN